MLIPCQRHLFDIPDDIAYLNCAFFSPKMSHIAEVGHAAVDFTREPWQMLPEHFFADSEATRALFARIIDAEPDDIALIPAASYGMAIVAANISIHPGDEIVLVKEQFPSNVYPWRELELAKGAVIRRVTPGEDEDWTSAITDAMGPKTALVALPHVLWTDGSLIDLERIGELCADLGCKLTLDITQSCGALPFSVKQVKADFVISSGYKWLMGPYSLGYMYIDPKWHDMRPIEHNWLNREESEDFAGLVNYRDSFQAGARRFDVGERSNFALMPMALKALEQILEWQVPSIQETLREMTNGLSSQCSELGFVVPPEEKRAGHLMGLRHPNGLPKGLVSKLRDNKVYVSIRGDSIRIAPYLYNNQDDLSRLVTSLSQLV